MYMINNHKIQNSSKNRRFSQVVSLDDRVFHTSDLANLWNIQKTTTLRQTLSRYVSQGLLFRIYKGLYSIIDPKNLDAWLLGVKAVHDYAYVSCESVLYKEGIINQPSSEITIVSRQSRRFSIGNNNFRVRRMNDKFLFNDVGINIVDGIRIATKSRAIADMLYFYPQKYFDSADSHLINWKAVRDIAGKIGYNVNIPKYDEITKQ